MVEKVKEIELELHLDALRDSEVLAHREIHVIVAGTAADANPGATDLTQVKAVQSVGLWIEPLPIIAIMGPALVAGNAHGPLQAVTSRARGIAQIADAVD